MTEKRKRCIFCKNFSTHQKFLVSQNATAELCKIHYDSKTYAEVLNKYLEKKNETIEKGGQSVGKNNITRKSANRNSGQKAEPVRKDNK